MSLRLADIAVDALFEVGRGDLANGVCANRRGFPSHRPGMNSLSVEDANLVARAFHLAHLTVHPSAVLEHDPDACCRPGQLGITCCECDDDRSGIWGQA